MRLGGLELVIFLEHRSRILLRRFERVELYLYRGATVNVIVLNSDRAVPALYTIKVCGQKLCVFANFIPAVGTLKLLTLACELALYTVTCGLDGVGKLPCSAAAAL